MFQIGIFITLLALGYFVGSFTEHRHYSSIKKREKQYLPLPAVTIRHALDDDVEIAGAHLVYGSVAISVDYFKRILAILRNIFGGEIRVYGTLLDRARREALLRMKEMALELGDGADIVLNVRLETSAIGKTAHRRKTVGCVEAIAYGTAVILKK